MKHLMAPSSVVTASHHQPSTSTLSPLSGATAVNKMSNKDIESSVNRVWDAIYSNPYWSPTTVIRLIPITIICLYPFLEAICGLIYTLFSARFSIILPFSLTLTSVNTPLSVKYIYFLMDLRMAYRFPWAFRLMWGSQMPFNLTFWQDLDEFFEHYLFYYILPAIWANHAIRLLQLFSLVFWCTDCLYSFESGWGFLSCVLTGAMLYWSMKLQFGWYVLCIGVFSAICLLRS
jgi:hypothetical protein